MESILDKCEDIFSSLEDLGIEEKVETINQIRTLLSEYSPFKAEPIDCVIWAKIDSIEANDYNPNSVAPPEMELLKNSILENGYTQPIVAWESEEEKFEVIDGFHRNRVGRECKEVSDRIKGYLPLAVINDDSSDRGERIAATIRHNRARGKHKIDSMSDIVVELKRRNWSDKKIGTKLGMDPDEVLRLCQISGLAEMFSDHEFSEAWGVEGYEESEEGIEDED
jgi:ParB-like chromosome segregation protein Spo0J